MNGDQVAVEKVIEPGGRVALIQAMVTDAPKIDALELTDEQAVVGAGVVQPAINAPHA